ncbi:Glucosamine-6-phosphate isomerase (Glucosamine-6-phosphate deaminase) (GNPDA) (GlcN6P deaminase) [Emydomyces testavorans]|uniref:Beta-hexosaminidase n=1 Tax=Emydomyces testavorans TaxID=2070801 RepID=A0AAF0DGZ9_9EURO|nr:Glucosamine-6-phosphate isomerase (Glucosamine-6-phosphate deaminase) (GNPDA) (GlcN6P deaminase) [Emydomyces testavorans]
MKYLTLSYFLLLTSCVHAIWPEPEQYTHGNSVVWLSPAVRFTYFREDSKVYDEAGSYFASIEPASLMQVLQPRWLVYDSMNPKSIVSVDEMLKKAIKRTRKELRNLKFVPWKFHPRNQSFEPDLHNYTATIREVIITERASGEALPGRDYVHGNESYQVNISKKGKVRIWTASPIGTLRALQTFPQLFYAHSSGSGVYTPYAPVSISDKPRWSHRGLNLDISRNPIDPDDVKRTIDAMASVKLNRLHIHATDSQSWPLDIPSMPSLAAKGAYHPSLVWSSTDLQEVQRYGLERGVSTFVEIDMPGHTGSIGHAFPDLVVAFGNDDWEKYALEPPSGQIKLNSSRAMNFLDALMEDIVPRVSPFTRYFHTGGDEFNLESYLLEESIRSKDSKILQPLLQAFITRVHTSIMEAGLTPIVWEELVLDWNLTFPASSSTNAQSVIVQAWRSSKAVKQLLEKGYRTIVGSGDAWYLDCGVGAFLNPRHGSNAVQEPFLDWCSPTKNWRHIYMYNPAEGIPDDLQPLIEGGETHMWAESVDPVNMDQMIWPRAASAAEVLWSGPRTRDDIKGASHRLGEWRERAVIDMGIGASMVQMTYCLMREGSCEL